MLEVDLLVIGGGINGVGVAADAAGRGLSVVLCEKGDLASGTSSESSKLIHGGLRYLEYYKFGLVHESLRERAILLKRAPHLVHPLNFILPYSKSMKPRWMLYAGLKLYDLLAYPTNLDKSKYISLKKSSQEKVLEESYVHGFRYADAQTDDARLVVLNALLAKEKGAKIFTHTECIKAERQEEGWLLSLRSDEGESQIKAKAIVNASGPWVTKVLHTVFGIDNRLPCRLVKGSHIVVPKLYEERVAYTLQNPDGRIIFVIPYKEDYSLIGTTDLVFTEDPDSVKISPEECDYLCENVNHYFKTKISPKNVRWSYSGVRALYDDHKKNAASVTREHKVEIDYPEKAPLISLYGGKLTSYRALSEEIVNDLKRYFPKLKAPWTRTALLPGGDLGMNFNDFVLSLQKQYPWMPVKILRRYANNYGRRSFHILKNASALKGLGVDFGAGLYQAEVNYLVQEEWAETVEDILWRRSKLGLESALIDIENLKNFLFSVT